MGAKQSSNTRTRTSSIGGQGSSAGNGAGGTVPSASGSGVSSRTRARSLGSVGANHSNHQHALSIPSPNGGTHSVGSPDSDSSTPEEQGPLRSFVHASSLPVHLLSFHGIKCPVCSKFVPPDDIECHLVMCLTKPRISYNEDVLTEDKGECVICLEDLTQGDTIARLPCLCIYHKSCIDSWFQVNRSCPEHPQD